MVDCEGGRKKISWSGTPFFELLLRGVTPQNSAGKVTPRWTPSYKQPKSQFSSLRYPSVISLSRPKSALRAKIFYFLGKITTAEGEGITVGYPPSGSGGLISPTSQLLIEGGASPWRGVILWSGWLAGGIRKYFFWIFGPLRIYPCNKKQFFFACSVLLWYLYMLGFGSKSAPMAKVLDFGTKKISKGGDFLRGGDQKTINFWESPAPRQGDETPPRLIGIFSKKKYE